MWALFVSRRNERVPPWSDPCVSDARTFHRPARTPTPWTNTNCPKMKQTKTKCLVYWLFSYFISTVMERSFVFRRFYAILREIIGNIKKMSILKWRKSIIKAFFVTPFINELRKHKNRFRYLIEIDIYQLRNEENKIY